MHWNIAYMNLVLSVFSAFQIRVQYVTLIFNLTDFNLNLCFSVKQPLKRDVVWVMNEQISVSMSLSHKHTAVISLTERPAVRCRNWSCFERNVRNVFCSATIFTACLCRNVIFLQLSLSPPPRLSLTAHPSKSRQERRERWALLQ